MTAATTVGRQVTEAITNHPVNQDGYQFAVPTFTTDEQVARFTAIAFKVTKQTETRNGVYWEAQVTDGTFVMAAENRGDGGANWYYADDKAGQRALEAFATELFPDNGEALDTLVMAVDMYQDTKAGA